MNTITIAEKLQEILDYSGWNQEQLAHQLDVSFSTINSWINSKSAPRSAAVAKIEDIYVEIVGRRSIPSELLSKTKNQAYKHKISVKKIINDEDLLAKITLYLTYHTNTIEGSTMTLSDVKQVLEDDNKVLSNKTAKEQMEARNHRTAFFFLLDKLNDQGKNFLWSVDLIKSIHLRLMNSIISNAGEFRRHGVRINGSIVKLADATKVVPLVDNLIQDLNEKSSDPIVQIAKIHSAFETIHPFSDGNGRTGRLIMFAQALHCGLVPPLIVKERKKAYYWYLELAQLDHQFDPLSLFIAESILFTDKLIKNSETN